MKFEIITLIVILLFGSLGAILLGIGLHELYHQYQYRGLQDIIIKEDICILNLQTNVKNFFNPNAEAGYYIFSYSENNSERVKEYKQSIKYLELIPSIITFTVVIIFLFFFIVMLIFRKKKLREIENFYDIADTIMEILENGTKKTE